MAKTRTAARRGKTRNPRAKTRTTAKPRAGASATKVSWLANGYPLLCSVSVVDECAQAIDWYKTVLGGKERLRLDMPGGGIGHCEIGFGGAVLMLASPMLPQYPPKKACLSLYVKDCDATFKKALAAGARSLQEPVDQFYGDRHGRFEDPFGNEWSVMTHIKDVSAREMKKALGRMASGS